MPFEGLVVGTSYCVLVFLVSRMDAFEGLVVGTSYSGVTLGECLCFSVTEISQKIGARALCFADPC